ncbi:MAG: hypothetical protein IJB89_08085 [Akkermansia sp.]|nr:hypothetical protein [Akkermansia sp.]
MLQLPFSVCQNAPRLPNSPLRRLRSSSRARRIWWQNTATIARRPVIIMATAIARRAVTTGIAAVRRRPLLPAAATASCGCAGKACPSS